MIGPPTEDYVLKFVVGAIGIVVLMFIVRDALQTDLQRWKSAASSMGSS
jgi:hypothetical protein